MSLLALYGGIGTPRGDYSGKEEQIIVPDVVEVQPTGGWLREEVKREEEERERSATKPSKPPKPPKAPVREAKPLTNKKPAKKTPKDEHEGLNLEETSRLINRLEEIQKQTRNRKIAAILLLAA